MRVRCAALVALAGCGRVAFDPAVDAGSADGGSGAWRLNQVVETTGANQIALAPTEQGALLIVAANIGSGNSIVMIDDDRASSYASVPAARCMNGGSGTIEVWYAAGADGGVGAITVTTATSAPVAMVVWEVANMRTSSVVDVANQLSTQPPTDAPVGAPVMTTAPGAFVVSVCKATVVSGVRNGGSFVLDSLASGDGYAHLAAASSPAGMYRAEWTSDVAEFCSSTVAFFVAR